MGREVDAQPVAELVQDGRQHFPGDLLVRPESMSRERAKRVTLSYLADVFPRHFKQPEADARS